MDDSKWMSCVESAKRFLVDLPELDVNHWSKWLAELREIIANCGARDVMPLVSAAVWLISNQVVRANLQRIIGPERPTFRMLCNAASIAFQTSRNSTIAALSLKSLKQAEDETLMSYINRFEMFYLSLGPSRNDPRGLPDLARQIIIELSMYSQSFQRHPSS